MKTNLEDKIKAQVDEEGYYGIDTHPLVDKFVAEFTKSEVPNLHAHYSDDDENAGQMLRVKLSHLLKFSQLELLDRLKMEKSKNKSDVWNTFVDTVNAHLSKLREEIINSK